WMGIEGHDDVVEQFRTALTRGRLASTFLFVGPEGVGKRAFAQRFAQTLLCLRVAPEAMAPCGECHGCRQVLSGSHPDLIAVSKPDDRAFIPLSLLIGDKDARGREGLCHAVSMRPMMGTRKVAIVDDADFFNDEGANSLLKTLEEPPPNSVMILISQGLERQLPTIRSRSQIVRFRPLPQNVVERLLVSSEIGRPEDAPRLARYSEGSLGRARELADPELWAFRKTLLGKLPMRLLDGVALAKETVSFAEQAGKESQARRARLRQVVEFAAEFFREVIRASAGSASTPDDDLRAAVAQAKGQWIDFDAAASALERCLETLSHIGRNVNQTTLVECWWDDLSRIAASQRPLEAAV
ncbi:MAG TPA: DNA polymerase III subunit, partial [Pirellulales bacterium]